MSFASDPYGNTHAGSETERQLQAARMQMQRALAMRMFEDAFEVCTDKCLTSPPAGGKLSASQQTCMTGCSKAFFNSSKIVGAAFQEVMAKNSQR